MPQFASRTEFVNWICMSRFVNKGSVEKAFWRCGCTRVCVRCHDASSLLRCAFCSVSFPNSALLPGVAGKGPAN